MLMMLREDPDARSAESGKTEQSERYFSLAVKVSFPRKETKKKGKVAQDSHTKQSDGERKRSFAVRFFFWREKMYSIKVILYSLQNIE